MKDQAEQLRLRTKTFAIRIVRVVRAMPRSLEAQILGRQLLKSGTSVAANYRAVCRARSKAEFVAKLGIVVEEADETVFWLELLGESETLPTKRLEPLLKEARELCAIFTASQHTVKHSRAK